ncbi:MAG TPA: peptidase U32 family protein [Bacteroidales bacterium]|nr:peptidase U32 family protein [Bacteroidales bacterium]HPT52000.1 peptidase U32 family protein [Bacteroidales bacterium]
MSIEIMSPVGSYESLAAAIDAGAGSVYFGIGKMNMRSRSAANFTDEDLHNITRICQENNVRSYLTVNTVIYNDEVEVVHQLLDLAKKCGVSAIIASDFAVINYCRTIGLEIHISTQCNITNIEAVRFFAQFADVMVLAREVILARAAEIHQAIETENICGPGGKLVKLEMFVHGALCMAVSGKCYLSLDNFNYSANRGACLQPCRRGYVVKDMDNELELAVENKYIMSPKDLCTIGFLDKLLKAGITVLKIEGRGRSAEYVQTTTACYHEAVSAILDGSYSPEKISHWMERLKTVYNRGFWDGYYLGRRMGEWSERYGSQATMIKEYVGKVTNFFSNLSVAEIVVETGNLSVGDVLLAEGPTTGVYELTVSEIRVDLKPVPSAVKGDVCSIVTDKLVRRGDKVYKRVTKIDEF